MATRSAHATLPSSAGQGFLSKSARRIVRQAASLANELDFSSFEACGIVWHRRLPQKGSEQAQGAARRTEQRSSQEPADSARGPSHRQVKSRKRLEKHLELQEKARLHRLLVALKRLRRAPQPPPSLLPSPPALC